MNPLYARNSPITKRRRLYLHTSDADASDAFGCICFDTSVVFQHTFHDEGGRRSLMLYDIFCSNSYEIVDFGFKDVLSILGCDKAVLFQLKGDPEVLEGAKYVVFQLVQRAIMIFEHGTWHVKARYVPVRNATLKNFTRLLPTSIFGHTITILRSIAPDNEGCFCTAYHFYIYQRHPDDSEKTNMYIIDNDFDGYTATLVTFDFLIADVAAGTNHAILLDNQGGLHVHGCGMHGELGLGPSVREAKKFVLVEQVAEQIPDGIAKVVACKHFNAVLTHGGDVFVWGWNKSYGDLPGIDSNILFVPVPLNLSDDATDIDIDSDNFTVVLENSRVCYNLKGSNAAFVDDVEC